MTDYTDFDLDRSTAHARDEFEGRLAEVVSVIDDSAPFTIGCASVGDELVPFVRFRSLDRDTLLIEASSNGVLDDAYQLGVGQLDQMDRLGWNPPAADGEFATACFWVRRPQEDADALAGLTVATLRDVFGVQHPVFLSPDQLAEILQPRPEPIEGESEFDAEDVIATIPVNSEHLLDMVETELTEMFGHLPLRDHEGDLAIRVGSTMLFIRISPDGVGRVPEGKALQMWVIGDEGPVSAGLMTGESTTIAGHAFTDASVVGITIEPEGGSDQPTTDPVVAIAL